MAWLYVFGSFVVEMNNKEKWNQNAKNGDLGAAKLVIPVASLLNGGGRVFGAETFPLPPF